MATPPEHPPVSPLALAETPAGRRKPPPSLRANLRRRLLPPLLLAIAVGAALSHRLIQHYTGEEQDRTLRETARALAQEVALGEHTDSDPVELLAGAERLLVWSNEDHTAYRLAGFHGAHIAGQKALALPPANAASGPGQTRAYDTALDGEPARAVAAPVPGGWHGRPAWLLLAETRHRRDAVAREVLLAVLLPQALLAILLIGLVQQAVRGGLAPLERLAGRLEARSDTRPETLPDADVPTEVRGLTHALNRLLARLDATLATQRRFVADAAHQLRTPLTALGLNIARLTDLLRQPDTTPAQRDSALASLAASTTRAVRLSEQLLSLARAEAHEPLARATPPIDLSATLLDALAEAALRASDEGVEISLDVPPEPVPVPADPVLVGEAARNLVENALAYARVPGRRLEVGVAVSAAPPGFSVRDNGPGVAPEHRARLFERFYRGDRSDSHGSGLGLAIVADIARRSGAEARLVPGLGPDGAGFGVGVAWNPGPA